ncbi:hypothetical protein ACFE04_009400 [Oxalis oulophora]
MSTPPQTFINVIRYVILFPILCKLTQLMERTFAKGQVVDDVLRISARIAAKFVALFLAELEGAPKKLLPQAIRWLIVLAQKPLLHPFERLDKKSVPVDKMGQIQMKSVQIGACLANTALVHPMVGFINARRRESGRRAITSLGFINAVRAGDISRYQPWGIVMLQPFFHVPAKVLFLASSCEGDMS